MRGLDVHSITDLVNKLAYFKPQRVNRYTIQIIDPIPGLPIPEEELKAVNVQIPSKSISYYPDSVGPFLPYHFVPLKQVYDDRFIIEFLVDDNFRIRKYFDDWMTLISGSPANPTSYTHPLYSPQMNVTGCKMIISGVKAEDSTQKSLKMTLHDVWPKLILPGQFRAENTGELLTMAVDMQYRYYTIENGVEGPN